MNIPQEVLDILQQVHDKYTNPNDIFSQKYFCRGLPCNKCRWHDEFQSCLVCRMREIMGVDWNDTITMQWVKDHWPKDIDIDYI